MRAILGLILLVMIGPGLFFWDGSIIKDINLKFEQLVPAHVSTTDRECRSKVFLFHICSYKYVENNEDKSQTYIFFAFGAPKTITLIKGNTSGTLTSDVGQNYLFNRIATILFFPFLLLWGVVKFMRAASAHRTAAGRETQLQAPPARSVSSAGSRPSSGGFGKRR